MNLAEVASDDERMIGDEVSIVMPELVRCKGIGAMGHCVPAAGVIVIFKRCTGCAGSGTLDKAASIKQSHGLNEDGQTVTLHFEKRRPRWTGGSAKACRLMGVPILRDRFKRLVPRREPRIDGWQDQRRQQRRCNQSANHDGREWALQFGARRR